MLNATAYNMLAAMFTRTQQDQYEDQLKEAKSIRGFVRPVAVSQNSYNKVPTLVGIFVAGNNGARVVYADRRAPEWFTNAIAEESIKSNPMQFRVRVGSISKNGSAVYVWPMADTLKQAEKEWRNEQVKADALPKNIQDCKDKKAVAQFVYQEYARCNSGEIVDFRARKTAQGVEVDEYVALMVKAPYFQRAYILLSGEDVWNFTDGIALGTTTLMDEIERAVVAKSL